MAGTRRKGRIVALQVLYEVDCSEHPWQITLDRALEAKDVSEQTKALAREIVEGVVREKTKLDTLIEQHAPAWPLEQMSAIDRNVLRIAIFEIVFNNKAPPKVAINEAVELAKSFGSENLHKFVNGVLGSVLSAAKP